MVHWPPFVLAFLLIVLFALVSVMITMGFSRGFLRIQVRRLPKSDPEASQQIFAFSSSGNTELWIRWIIELWLNRTGHPGRSNPLIRALAGGVGGVEPGLAPSLRLPERAVTRFRPVIHFHSAYAGLRHQFSSSNYPSVQIWGYQLLPQHHANDSEV
ncbi:hypothetical protein IW261DRAFT_1414880 [Armillaria novae-zelandiae]|uniref:Uncharacterized protein n=1 Tax=Armillaria novae-zelandiae TaxID=153914 RepID=A0AA39UFD2_9AGAR|nr:hypothetical protein IW261DRAFT_1414880 [Armillaria novae-zelandiae]